MKELVTVMNTADLTIEDAEELFAQGFDLEVSDGKYVGVYQ